MAAANRNRGRRSPANVRNQFKRRTIDSTVVLVGVLSLALSAVLYVMVTAPMMSEIADLTESKNDYQVSTADLRAQLYASEGGQPDSVTEQMRQVEKMRGRLASFDTTITPSTTLPITAPAGVAVTVELLDSAGAGVPTAQTSPEDFYTSTGESTMYVRYKFTAGADGLPGLQQLLRDINRSKQMLQIVNPELVYTPPAPGGVPSSSSSATAAKPWQLTGELWMWGEEQTPSASPPA